MSAPNLPTPQTINDNPSMTRYYLIKEVDGIVVRKTEIFHEEPRDTSGRYVSSDPNWAAMQARMRLAKARHVRCPRCGYKFIVN